MRTFLYIAFTLTLINACKGPDNFRPVVEYLIVNDINSDTLDSDTIFDVHFPINTEFKLTDNEGVKQYRFEFNRTADTIPDLHLIEVKSIGDVKEYVGGVTVDFDQSVLDTIPPEPGFYFISVNCFDKSGNQAFQKKNIIEIIIN